MSTLHRSTDGDMIDEICRAHYGTEAHAPAVYDANPGLAAHGPVLPAGLVLVLPEIETTPIGRPIRLWGG